MAPATPIAADLSTDRGFMDSQDIGDLGLAMIRFHQGINLVTLVLDERLQCLISVSYSWWNER